MKRVLLSAPEDPFVKALLPALEERELEPVFSDGAPEVPEGVFGIVVSDLVPALMVQPDPAASLELLPPEAGLAWLEELFGAAARGNVSRIVLISAPDVPGLVPEPVARAARRIEAALARAAGVRGVVLRCCDIMDPAGKGMQRAVRRLVQGGIANWPARDVLEGVALSDLAAASAAALRARDVGGRWFHVAAEPAADRMSVAAEVERLGQLLTDPATTEVAIRPAYPVPQALLDARPARKALGFRCEKTIWAVLAETVQELVRQAERAGHLPPLRPPLPFAQKALETGALPLFDRRVVLTGATGAIGRALSEILVRLGATVVGVARSAEDGARLAADIEARRAAFQRLREHHLRLARETGQDDTPFAVEGEIGRFEFEAADLSDPEEIRLLARRLDDRPPRLDVLINAAATVRPEREETAQGTEKALAVNLVAPVTLTRLLAGALERAGKAGGARVVNVVTDEFAEEPFDLDDPHSRWAYAPGTVHARTKAGLVMMTAALAEVAAASGVSVVAASCAPVRSALRDVILSDGMGAARTAQERRARLNAARQQLASPASAALQIAEAIVSPKLVRANGAVISNGEILEPPDHVRDPARLVALWQLCAELGGLTP